MSTLYARLLMSVCWFGQSGRRAASICWIRCRVYGVSRPMVARLIPASRAATMAAWSSARASVARFSARSYARAALRSRLISSSMIRILRHVKSVDNRQTV